MKRGICGGIMAVLFAVLVGILLAPWRWDGAGGMHLLGEELIDGGGSARRFAHAMHSEATAIWADRRSWHQATRQSDAHESMQVESIRIDHGPFNASGVLLTRGVATIANVSARARLAVAVSQWPHEYPPEFAPYEGPRLSPRGIHGHGPPPPTGGWLGSHVVPPCWPRPACTFRGNHYTTGSTRALWAARRG